MNNVCSLESADAASGAAGGVVLMNNLVVSYESTEVTVGIASVVVIVGNGSLGSANVTLSVALVIKRMRETASLKLTVVTNGVTTVGVGVRRHSRISAVVTVAVAVVRVIVTRFSYKVTAFIITVGVAFVVKDVRNFTFRTDVITSRNSTLGSAIVLVAVVGMLPLSYKGYVLDCLHFFKVPFGSLNHPSYDLVAVLFGNTRSNQSGSGFNRLLFNYVAVSALKSNRNGLLSNKAEVYARSEAKHQQSQTQG